MPPCQKFGHTLVAGCTNALFWGFGRTAVKQAMLGIFTSCIGRLPGGYFLAAKEAGAWVIVYDGQATPSCAEIAFDGYGYPHP